MALDLQTLSDRAEIQDIVAKYCRAIDRRDGELLASIYHEDAIEDRGEGIFYGLAKEWRKRTLPVLAVFEITQHSITNHLVEFEGDVAHSETYFQAYHRFGKPPQHSDDVLPVEWPPEGTEMILSGRYLDRLEKRDGEWKIAHRRMVCDWCRTQPVLDEWFQQNPLIYRGAPTPDNSFL